MVVSLSFIRYFSSDPHHPHSFTLSYLTKTCGLSPQSAIAASKIVQFESSEQPDSVLPSFQNFGFSKIQLSEMIKKFPKLLSCSPDKTIFPKIEFFCSKGASTPDLVTIFTVNPWILKMSLESKLVASFNFFVELFQSEHKAIELIKRNPRVLSYSIEAVIIPNMNTLRENGVSESNILWVIQNHCQCLGINTVKFGKIVEEIKEMEFNPLKSAFVQAITIFIGVTKPKRDQKVEVYKRWGWSDNDVITAFKKYPWCLSISEDKLMAVMDFYVNTLGFDSSVIMNCPILLGYSLKKRLIPRERRFLEKYVNCHQEAPQLVKLYNHNLNLFDTSKSGKDEE
ncbi:uncharacterized protein [Euphorbia lathyris]|uniref:uncharacterized protein isoform X2 n=1 Tax=Euphorbia lathyris TaxID=212925 RepID=UPI0033131D35